RVTVAAEYRLVGVHERKVEGVRKSRHVRVPGTVDVDSKGDLARRPAEIRRVDEGGAGGVELRDKGIGVVLRRRLKCAGGRRKVRLRAARHVGGTGTVDRDRIDAGRERSEIRAIYERGATGI